MNVIFIAQECFPFAKASSLGDLVSKLSKEIEKEGHNVKVFIPRYAFIEPQTYCVKRVPFNFKLKGSYSSDSITVYKGILPNTLVNVYLIESQNYFSNLKEIPLTSNKETIERNMFFSQACLEVILKLKFEAYIIHLFNPDTAQVAKLMKTRSTEYLTLSKTSLMFTIHSFVDPTEELIKNTNEAIDFCDFVTTVSKTYAYELLSDIQGLGISSSLSKKKDTFAGILSGIDQEVYNPEKDVIITQNYSKNYFSIGKRKCKEDLLNQVGLEKTLQTPLFAFIGNLREDKGTNFLISSIPQISTLGLQLIILGKGEQRFEQELTKLESKYKNIKVCLSHDYNLSKKIYAGADFFINLSKYVPSGMSVMNAMRYGSVPIAYSIGAIKDIVIDIEFHEEANGFTFKNYEKDELIETILKAIKVYKNKEKWPKLVKAAMSFEPSRAAKTYIDCYERILKVATPKHISLHENLSGV